MKKFSLLLLFVSSILTAQFFQNELENEPSESPSIFIKQEKPKEIHFFEEGEEYEEYPDPPDQGVDAGAPGTVDEVNVDQYWFWLILSTVVLFGYIQRKQNHSQSETNN
ncbi:hypothetical protein [Moheibacter stercoris]|uniref:MYXO-CTERM domain-containing protein n=1 Tax=Moheibacter stercoris TaxID=1628251 RepID=A0ABV2LV39_9FLAO